MIRLMQLFKGHYFSIERWALKNPFNGQHPKISMLLTQEILQMYYYLSVNSKLVFRKMNKVLNDNNRECDFLFIYIIPKGI